MKVLWNNQECPVIEKTANLYFIEIVETDYVYDPLYSPGALEEHTKRRIVPVRKDWVTPVEEV